MLGFLLHVYADRKLMSQFLLLFSAFLIFMPLEQIMRKKKRYLLGDNGCDL